MIKNGIILILGICCALFAFNNFLKEKAINSLTEQNTTLAADLKAQITFTPKRQIIYKTRTQAGEVKTVVKYLPPESTAEIKQSSDGENIELSVNALGLTFRPALVGLLGQNAKIGAGARLVYWQRYGAGLGGAYSDQHIYPFAFLDRRIDDLVPFFQNTSLGVSIHYQNQSLTPSLFIAAYL